MSIPASSGLRRRLLRSHLTVAAVGLGLLGVALGSTLWLRANTLRLITVESPIADASKRLDGGVQRSLAALRGWVALGDERFRRERQDVWTGEIRPALSHLVELNRTLPSGQTNPTLPALSERLDDLQGSQWWVEDVAQRPGNEPARVALTLHLNPIAESIFTSITNMLDIERGQPVSAGQRERLEAMTDFRGWFTRADAFLHILVSSADTRELNRFDTNMEIAAKNLDRIGDMAASLTPAQRRHLKLLHDELIAYEYYAREALELQQNKRWNIAHYLMSTETAPLSRQIGLLLADMSADQAKRIAAHEADVILLSNMAIALLLALILAMALVAVGIARRNSQSITDPITRLSAAAETFAAGELEHDLAIDSDDEIGRLTASFNTMRKSLWDAQNHLEQLVSERTTELTEANEQLAKTNQELEEFAYITSHDLQEPLRNLISYSELLRQDLGSTLPKLAAEDLNFINHAAERMQLLIHSLLALSKANRSELHIEPTAIDECLDHALEALTSRIEATGAEIRRDPLPTLACDSPLIVQLYQNLIGNALKFSDGDRPQVHLTAEQEGEVWVLGVRDNGIGIKAEYAEQIFVPFKRLHDVDTYEGTGIGLSLCRKVVDRHHGRIWVDSQPGQGAHFKFTLS